MRKRGLHLINAQRKEFDFTYGGLRDPVFFNEPTDPEDVSFRILHKKEATQEERMYELVKKINKKMSNLQRSINEAAMQIIPKHNYNSLKRAETFL